ncbi:MAG: GAF domain-containing protein [Deltaproteobacteria bacterium]|nr:GAF domain-containing protein [Deltaproteobacteria bacterium]
MTFTVAVPVEHQSALGGTLPDALRRRITWASSSPAEVVLGLPGAGRFAACEAWPGLAGAAALVRAGWDRHQDRLAMDRLHDLGRALAAEQDLDRLLERILAEGRALLRAEAGSLYLLKDSPRGPELLFAYTQNERVELPFRRVRIPITRPTIAGRVAATAQPLNLPDVYDLPPDVPYRFDPSFDRAAGYRTTSMLVVPMTDVVGEVLGVLQFINRVETDAQGARRVVPFPEDDEELAQSLAAQAGVALKNMRLRRDIEQLFEAFVDASVGAIESRDPTTSGHSGRVAVLTVSLAEALQRQVRGPYAGVRFTPAQLRELRYASLLHDFGKVGVREEVLVKAKKLPPGRMEVILQRLRQRGLELTLEALSRAWEEGLTFDPARLEALRASHHAEVEEWIALVQSTNEPNVLPVEVKDNLAQLACMGFWHWSGQTVSLLEPEDLVCLQIPRGTLSAAERREIEGHVTHTYRFLSRIPWTRDLSRVPEIAYAHHERLRGTGYPRGLVGDEIPLQSRAMAIADVFDALTASDRPYKGAVPLERSLAILESEAHAGNLDSTLVELFVQARVWQSLHARPDSMLPP